MDCSGDRVFSVELLWTLFYKLLPPPIPPLAHSLRYTGPKLVSKNDVKWPQIKQVTNSKLYYNKANELLSPVLQKIVGQTRAKAGYTN